MNRAYFRQPGTVGTYLGVILVSVTLALSAGALMASTAVAATHITSNITTNTTWGPSGSPYLLDKQVKVVSGVTLKLLPGTQVEFNSTSGLTFYVEGSMESIGSAESPIEFTSSQAAEGKGAPGQYHGINVIGSAASGRFAYTKFYYGGSGSGGYYAYGVLTAQSGASVRVEDSTFEWNAYSAIKIGEVSSAKVFESTLKHNGDGIASSTGPITIAHNKIEENAEYGLHFNWIKTSTEPGAEVENNEITKNGSSGVYLSGYCSAATSTFPHGSLNNIYGNGPAGEYPADGSELRTIYLCEAIHVNWDNNYWGAADLLSGLHPIYDGKFICKTLIPANYWTGAEVESGHFLGYTSFNPAKRPPGPINTGDLIIPIPYDCGDGTGGLVNYHNIYNSINVNEFSAAPFVIT